MPRPSKFPRWADLAAPADVVEPPESRKDSGWLAGERPPAPMFNWLGRTGHEWLVWLDAESQRLSTAAAGVAGQITAAVNGLKNAANTWAALQTFTNGLTANAASTFNANATLLGNASVLFKSMSAGQNGGYVPIWRGQINGAGAEGLAADVGLYLSDDTTQFASDGVTSNAFLLLVVGAFWDGSNWQAQQSGALNGKAGCIALRKNGGLYRGVINNLNTARTFTMTQLAAPV